MRKIVTLDTDVDAVLPTLEGVDEVVFTTRVPGGSVRARRHGLELIDRVRKLPALRALTLEGAGIDEDAAYALGQHLADSDVESLDLSLNELTDRGLRELLRPGLPRLRRLVLRGCRLSRRGAMVLSRARLDGLRELDLGMNTELEPPDLVRLNCLAQLEWLSLRGIAVGDAVLVPLLRETRNLRVLDLSFTRVGALGLAALLASPSAHVLERLELEGVELRGEALEPLDGPQLPNLKALDLSRTRLGRIGATHLGRAILPSLEELRLAYCDLDAMASGQILQAPHPRLRVLSLHENRVAGRDLRSLHSPLLRELDLTASEAGDDAAELAAVLPKLEELRLSRSKVTLDGAEALARSTAPLRVLVLDRNPLGPDAAGVLVQRAWPNLEELDLSVCDLRDAGAEAIARIDATELRRLDLSWNDVRDRGAIALAGMEVAYLSVHWNRIGDRGLQALQRAPWPQVFGMHTQH